jgi:hypothetical protein
MAVALHSMVLTSVSIIIVPSRAIIRGAGGGKLTAIADGIDACQAGGSDSGSSVGTLYTSQCDICLWHVVP